MSDNAKEEEPPRDDEPFDYQAKPTKFYFEVETDGSLSPQEVVMKVRFQSLICVTALYLTGFFCQGLAELQTKLANLIYGLKNQPDLELMPNEQPQNGAVAETGGWGGVQAPTAPPAWPGGASSQWGTTSPGQASTANVAGWGASPNAGSWSSGATTGWASPGQQANGWNV